MKDMHILASNKRKKKSQFKMQKALDAFRVADKQCMHLTDPTAIPSPICLMFTRKKETVFFFFFMFDWRIFRVIK
jgi:hypothetical protein